MTYMRAKEGPDWTPEDRERLARLEDQVASLLMERQANQGKRETMQAIWRDLALRRDGSAAIGASHGASTVCRAPVTAVTT